MEKNLYFRTFGNSYYVHLHNLPIYHGGCYMCDVENTCKNIYFEVFTWEELNRKTLNTVSTKFIVDNKRGQPTCQNVEIFADKCGLMFMKMANPAKEWMPNAALERLKIARTLSFSLSCIMHVKLKKSGHKVFNNKITFSYKTTLFCKGYLEH